jgi:hypothetical protein
VPIRALITIHDPDAAVLEGPSASADVLAASPGTQEPVVTASLVSPSLVGPTAASATADLPARRSSRADRYLIGYCSSRADRYFIGCCFFFWRRGSSGLYRCHSIEAGSFLHRLSPHLSRDRYALFFLITSVFFLCALLTLFSTRIWIFQSSSCSILPQLDRPYWKPMTLP